MLGELDIPFDVFTTFFAHMLTLSTVVLIQVYINYIKKLLKVGFILVTIFVIASIGFATASESVSVPAMPLLLP